VRSLLSKPSTGALRAWLNRAVKSGLDKQRELAWHHDSAPLARLTDSGLKSLPEYRWPGNVRQLHHLVERLTILAPSG